MPRILHDLFKHHYKDSWEVEWDDSEKQRKDLAAKMKRKKVQPWFSSKEVEEKSIALWDVTNSCAALNAMADLPQYITNVRKARNDLLHQTETEVPLEGFNKIKDCVQELISEPDLSLPKDVYQKELDTLASCEFSVCCGFLCTVLNLILSTTLRQHPNCQNSRYSKMECSQ